MKQSPFSLAACLLLAVVLLITVFPQAAFAQDADNAKPTYFKARVSKVLEDGKADNGAPIQKLEIEVLSGKQKGALIVLLHGDVAEISENQKMHADEKIVVMKTLIDQNESYLIIDTYRLPWVFAGFMALAIIAIGIARWRGFASLLGLIVSIAVLVWFVVPNIMAGRSPLLITLIGSLIIAITSITIAHGFKRRTIIALISTIATLCIAIGISIFFVYVTRLSGLADEDAFILSGNITQTINFSGLLLGGMIIGTLGVLDDITTAQSAAVEEIKIANPNLQAKHLFKKGMNIGKEHIASLINTLALAYIGASLPLLILFTHGSDLPLWAQLNNELIVEEMVRMVVGSIALIAAVPITTFLAAKFARPQAE